MPFVELIHTTETKPAKINLKIKKEKANDSILISRESMLHIKDNANISDRQYEILKQNIPQLPSMHSIKQLRKRNEELFMDGNGEIDVNAKINFHILNYLDKNPETQLINIKISGDGINVGSKKKLFNFSFSILNDRQKCTTATGNYLLGLYEIDSENDEELKRVLIPVFEQLKEIQSITYENRTIAIIKFIGGDLKFLLLYFGINAANSTYYCLYCTVSKKEELEKTLVEFVKQKFSVNDTKEKARSFSEHSSNISNLGYKTQPISKIINHDHCCFDLLHFFTRSASGVLFERLLSELSSSNNQARFIEIFRKHIEDSCGIKEPFKIENNKYEMKSISGHNINLILHNSETLFDNLSPLNFSADDLIKKNLQATYSSIDRIKKLSLLWKEYHQLYWKIKRVTDKSESIIINKRVLNWLDLFINLYHLKFVSPYIHLFCFHAPQLIELYGDLDCFNQEGLERKNFMICTYYFRSCNKKGNYLKQIISKINRLEMSSEQFEYKVSKRKKRAYEIMPDTLEYYYAIKSSLKNKNITKRINTNLKTY
jgi:hypothetical protein